MQSIYSECKTNTEYVNEKGRTGSVIPLKCCLYYINDDENKHTFAFLKLIAKFRNEKK